MAVGLVLAVGGPLVAAAQTGLYGKLDLTNYSASGSSTTFYGGGGGIYNDFLHAGPVHAGVDLRGGYGAATNLAYRDFLAGVRVGVKLPVVGLRPYAQGSVGIGGTKVTGPTAAGIVPVWNNKLLGVGFLGVDVTVLPHVDWRAVELGFGRINGLSANEFKASTGVVLRF